GQPLSAEERVEVVKRATLEVRSATIFGELIIAIVYVPLFALAGTEAKLFRPMATTVLLALAGAFLLSLTVVPVLASIFVRAKKGGSDETRVVQRLHRLYVPFLGKALEHRWVTLTIGLVALGIAGVLVPRLGAEFVPKLDEGDLLLEARRLPGVSLTESLATETRLERALLGVPEILHVVGRTGAPEIATDPMGVEQTDVYLQLAPRERWRKGLT